MDGFLVDCGSAVSVSPPTAKEERSPSLTEHNLSAANGQRLRTFGRRNARVMVVADVVHHILGMYFFQYGEGNRCIFGPRICYLIDRYTME